MSTSGGNATSTSTSTPGATGGGGVTGTTGTASTGVVDDDDGSIFDLAPIPDAPIGGGGCAGIDFLFVIDNSNSMAIEQGALIASFEGFINAIEGSLEEVDSFHVGVITSDEYSHNSNGCRSLGDLVTRTFDNGACGPFVDGNRFLTDADDLPSVFPCLADVGLGGSGAEQPISALVAAVSEEKAQPGGCNEGFIRDDSILVVVVVTDDPPNDEVLDDAGPIDTSGWVPAVLAAKDDNPEAVVVIGFIPWVDGGSCFPQWDSPNLIDFVDAFGDQGVKAPFCAADFAPVFQSTVETIKTSCDNFTPEG